MSDATEKPELLFFRSTPIDLQNRVPLASSLQSFESGLFLIALGRYPHALATCTFAIENAIRAAFKLPSRGGDNLHRLLERAREQLPTLREFPQQDVDELRKTRNRIVHYGFSPKDDTLAATLLLQSALPLLATVYQGFFSLTSTMD